LSIEMGASGRGRKQYNRDTREEEMLGDLKEAGRIGSGPRALKLVSAVELLTDFPVLDPEALMGNKLRRLISGFS
jgi:hypothetical protein